MNNKDKSRFKYLLRYAVQPGFQEEARIDALLSFCGAAGIDDVMFFVNCEEINQGHLTAQQTDCWLELVARAKKRLAAIGVRTSLNPWQTLLHADRGRRLKPGQKFELMADTDGRRASAQVCPLCPAWRKYLARTFAQYAALRPDIVWVEDDFRFHNHAPLKWGGCFCDRHMRRFSQLVGRRVSRREFFKRVVQPGPPHPWRKAWLDLNRQTINELARLIDDAVSAVSPRTRVGLMTSVPSVHAAEGRDWHTLLGNLSGRHAPVVRPHLPAYPEDPPGRYLWNFAGITAHTQAVVPPGTVLYPELDNFAVSVAVHGVFLLTDPPAARGAV
jgi:hypothetical protein